MLVNGCKVMVVGMAKSGIATAQVLCKHGAIVTINDNKTRKQLPEINQALRDLNFEDALGIDPNTLLDCIDMIVLSPGVPMSAPFVQLALDKGIEVIGEIELGYRFCEAPIVAISGTNGKTTTTALTGEIFRTSGRKTFVLGNIGVPLISQAQETTADDIVVAEVAGFQLESTNSFHTPCCAMLNISQDHLDRFGTMENYIASKEKMFANQTPRDFAVLNADDPTVSAMNTKTAARILYFSRKKQVENGAYVENSQIVFVLDGKKQIVCATSDLRIPGEHNLENALAATCLAMAMGVAAIDVAAALKTFAGVEHRIEFVCKKNGVSFINDSKGTNPDSTVKAVEAMKDPTILLLGGSNKNSDYRPVFDAFNGNIKAVIAFGETRDQILRDAKKSNYETIYSCEGSFSDVIDLACTLAQPGDTVLLSPACASYDMFDNFEHRGRVFKELVSRL